MTAQIIHLTKDVAKTMNNLRISCEFYRNNDGTGLYRKALRKSEAMYYRYLDNLVA